MIEISKMLVVNDMTIRTAMAALIRGLCFRDGPRKGFVRTQAQEQRTPCQTTSRLLHR